ncbi:MAG: uracil-DNA glycosylase [Proteobacteria bacterium]|nr:uracil-DNA glycosylase [Pseudomonadota bacterium]
MSNHLLSELAYTQLTEDWKKVLGEIFLRPEFAELSSFLEAEYSAGKMVFPDRKNLFRAFSLVRFEDVKVVLLGQDPYHGEGQANGLAFAVNDGLKTPPSLKNIFKELNADLNAYLGSKTSLEGWAQQGVLLLNTVLTVRAHEAFSHRGQGWEKFTEAVIKAMNNHPNPLVFILWGGPAQQKESLVTDKRHLILKAAHPSPLSAHRGFLGCRHFSTANSFLARTGREICWQKIDRSSE